jgi:hypothetical protein
MKLTIAKKTYDTKKDKEVAHRTFGSYGQIDGFEEKLFVNDKQFYIYGVGGVESPYAEPTIALMSDEDAESWKKDNDIE